MALFHTVAKKETMISAAMHIRWHAPITSAYAFDRRVSSLGYSRQVQELRCLPDAVVA